MRAKMPIESMDYREDRESKNYFFMNIDKIQEMFSEMGLGTSEQREKMVKELSINMVDSNSDQNVEIINCSNTLKSEHYA